MARPKGSTNKVTRQGIQALFPLWEKTIEAGMRSKKMSERLKAAQIAAPYLAQKLPEVIDNRNTGKISIVIEYAKTKVQSPSS